MSVDTNVIGKNLAPYRRMRQDDLRVLVTPQLAGLADSLRVTTRGGWRKRLTVELAGPGADACPV